MTEYKFKFGKEELKIDVPRPADLDSFFVFAMHKSGSVLLNNMIRDVCNYKNIPFINIPTCCFNNGIRFGVLDNRIDNLMKIRGYAYVGFRNFLPYKTDFDFKKVKNILLIRDPRDMIVSQYFSAAYSHTIPKKGDVKDYLIERRENLQNMDIDLYASEYQKFVTRQFKRYETSLPVETTKLYRYEDVIFKKREWLRDMLDFLEMDIPVKIISKIAEKHDVMPEKEDSHKHIRQVVPGNYKKHLKQKTIDKLNEKMADILDCYGYNSVHSFPLHPCPKVRIEYN